MNIVQTCFKQQNAFNFVLRKWTEAQLRRPFACQSIYRLYTKSKLFARWVPLCLYNELYWLIFKPLILFRKLNVPTFYSRWFTDILMWIQVLAARSRWARFHEHLSAQRYARHHTFAISSLRSSSASLSGAITFRIQSNKYMARYFGVFAIILSHSLAQ